MNGQYYNFEGRDGQNYTLLQVKGGLNEQNGIFELFLMQTAMLPTNDLLSMDFIPEFQTNNEGSGGKT